MNDRTIVQHPNGYSGVLMGKSTMMIYDKDDNCILHTCFRTPNTEKELYEVLETMPRFIEILASVEADRKTESDSEKPNNCEMPCEECGHWEHGAGNHYYCALLEMGQECYFESKNESTLMFANEPKTEPEVRSNLEPFRADEPQTDPCDRYVVTNDEGERAYNCIGCEQTDCAWAAPDAPRTVPLYPMKGGEETNEDNSR